jgi:hypothetical protein
MNQYALQSILTGKSIDQKQQKMGQNNQEIHLRRMKQQKGRRQSTKILEYSPS